MWFPEDRNVTGVILKKFRVTLTLSERLSDGNIIFGCKIEILMELTLTLEK